MTDFTKTEILKFLGRLTNKWSTGHDSITKILDKVERFLDKKSDKVEFLDKVNLFVAMLRDHSNQNYYIDDGTLGSIIACLAYLVLPTDLVPDFIPITGFTDDAAAFMLVMNQISNEILHYKEWKKENSEPSEKVIIDIE